MECMSCGCTEDNACQLEDTGEVCGWAATSPWPVCTFCAEGDDVADAAVRQAEQEASWLRAEHEQQSSPAGQRAMAAAQARREGKLFAAEGRG